MKKIISLLSILLLTIFTMSFIVPGEWVPFATKSCNLLFPKKPESQAQLVNTAIGQLQLNIYSYEPGEKEGDSNLVYMLMETEYPDSIIHSDKKDMLDDFFRKSIDGAVNNVHGKLLAESVIQHAGFPGREVRVDFRDGLAVINMRFYLVKNKLFLIQTITLTKNDFNKSINRFMDSFKLVN